MQPAFIFLLMPFLVFSCTNNSENLPQQTPIQISGIYPHLTAYNQPEDSASMPKHLECGIGAVVPWAGSLWYITYPPHQRTGSNDKLHQVNTDLELQIRPESIGGTHANRMIHKESEQLIIGYHFIDKAGTVRTVDPQQLEGRMTATTRHLSDPENWVYFYDMEGKVYEVNVHTLEVKQLFQKPVPGWHGKGAYVGQGRFIVANNGEHEGHTMGYEPLLVGGQAQSREEAGVLAEWDGKTWRIIERKQFTDVTGPGGLYGNSNANDPVWSMGWDKRSVILKLLDKGTWHTYRLPKASHTFDPRHGWFTEWPRIRAIGPDHWMMAMHGTLFNFPKNFSQFNTVGLAPISTHLRYIPDFCYWNGQVVLAADDASRLQNPIVGQQQSNLWFGDRSELDNFGPASGWGGVWLNDSLAINEISDPFLFNGYEQRILHIKHDYPGVVEFIIEIDNKGDGLWTPHILPDIEAKGYAYYIFPSELNAQWVRIKSTKACKATAYFHYRSSRKEAAAKNKLFDALPAVTSEKAISAALIRPAGHNKSLQIYLPDSKEYVELDLNESKTDLTFETAIPDRGKEVKELAALQADTYEIDEASIILNNYDGKRYRLPKSSLDYESLWPLGRGRVYREVQSERYLANIHGLFYEIPRAEGANNHIPEFQKIKPICQHNRKIVDYCSWRGLLVLSGVDKDAIPNGQVFSTTDGLALWFGAVDDLWHFPKPKGIGGPWKNTPVKANIWSDAYIMTGFDQKRMELSHNALSTIDFTVEVAINHEEWVEFDRFSVAPKELFSYTFENGYMAHWIRLKADKSCEATATFYYD